MNAMRVMQSSLVVVMRVISSLVDSLALHVSDPLFCLTLYLLHYVRPSRGVLVLLSNSSTIRSTRSHRIGGF